MSDVIMAVWGFVTGWDASAVEWTEIQAFFGVVGILFAVGAWVQSLWLKLQLLRLKSDIIDHVDENYMPEETLNHKFTQVNKRIDRLESPPVTDKLESMRLSIAHLSKQLEERV